MRWVLLSAALAIFGAGVGLAYRDQVEAASATFVAGVFVLIFTFLSRFRTFSGLGIKAEMWEDKQKEAAEMIDRLGRLATATAAPILSIAPRMGRIGRYLTRQELFDAVSRIEAVLAEAGIARTEIEQLKRDYYRTSMFDMTRAVRNAIKNSIQERVDALNDEAAKIPQPVAGEDLGRYQSLHNRRLALGNGLRRIDENIQKLSFENIPDQLEAEILELPEFSDKEKAAFLAEHQEALEDMRYFAREKKFRRLQAWLEGES